MLVPYLQILHGVAAHHLQLEDRLLAWLLLSMRSTRLDSAPASRGDDDERCQERAGKGKVLRCFWAYSRTEKKTLGAGRSLVKIVKFLWR